jgi:hypothetical protein
MIIMCNLVLIVSEEPTTGVCPSNRPRDLADYAMRTSARNSSPRSLRVLRL